MISVSSFRIKLLLALTIAVSIVLEGSAQTLRKLDLGNSKPRARSGHVLVNVKGNVFMFGGFNASLPPDNDLTTAGDVTPQNVYGPFDGFFRVGLLAANAAAEFVQERGPEGQVPVAFGGHSVNEETGDIFFFLGLTREEKIIKHNTGIQVFNPGNGKEEATWETILAEGKEKPPSRDYTTVVSSKNNNFIFGGQAGNKVFDDAWRHDGREFVLAEKMPEKNSGCSKKKRKKKNNKGGGKTPKATVAAEEEEKELIYIIGGIEDVTKDPTGKIFIYDTEEDQWIEEGSQTAGITVQADEATKELLARAYAASVEVGDTLYLFGGLGKNRQELDDIIKVVFNDDDTVTAERLAARFPAGFRDSAAALVSLKPIKGFEASGLHTVEILIFGGAIRGRDTDDAFIFTDTVEINETPTTPDECTGGPTVKSISVGSKTKIKGNGFLDGLTITVNGIGFTKSPSVTPNKVTQKGPLTNGQSASEACESGCEFKITTRDNKCTKVSVP